MKRNYWRKSEVWKWAKQWASLLDGILPNHIRETALATCRITLRDKDNRAAGGAWGFAILTSMQTYGHEPKGIPTQIRRAHNWIILQSEEAADVILGLFGITLEQVIAHYGKPDKGEKIELNLYDVIGAIAPDFALAETVAVA